MTKISCHCNGCATATACNQVKLRKTKPYPRELFHSEEQYQYYLKMLQREVALTEARV